MTFRAVLPALLVLVIVGSLFIGLLAPHGVIHAVLAVTARLRAMGPAGWAICAAAIFAITLVGIVPGSVLGVAAGAIYGVTVGFVLSAIGIFAGAVVAFALSRSMFRPWIAGVLGSRRRLGVLDRLVSSESWKIVALLRISPVMPFSVTSYALGLSGIAARDYVLGTLASLPPLLGYVVIGVLGRSTFTGRSRGETMIHAGLLALGVVATLALTVHLSRLLARALRAA
jgi:uncharacterized membrane protein YdjX (TVP38/TMEM64 family)